MSAVLCSDMPDQETARMLLAYMFDLGTDYKRALVKACAENDFDLVKLMLASRRVFINGTDALNTACFWGFLDLAKLLVAEGGYLHQDTLDEAMSKACAGEQLDVMRWLYEIGASITRENYVVFVHACQSGYTDIVRFILELGVIPVGVLQLGYNAVFTLEDKVDIVELLLTADTLHQIRVFKW